MTRLRLALCGLALLAISTGCDSDGGGGTEATVRVMSQNLYLGGDLFTLLEPQCEGNAIVGCVAQLYATIEASDPAARMAAIAAEIARVDPDLVGLQEVSTYYVQSPGDNQTGSPTPATQVTFDFLDLLMDALAAEGADYRVVSVSNNADVEFPATTDGATFFDVRYQDADVILARGDVTTGATTEQSFQSLLTIPIGGAEQTFVRGYQSVEATVGGLDFTFFNTHLEVGGQAEAIQVLQASELLTPLGAASGPIVFVGDINSNGNANGTSYQTLTVPLDDAFAVGADPTCCQAADLRNAASQLQTRIDVVFHRGFDSVAEAEVVLDDPSDRVGGLWPSDHAGVWAELSAVVQ
jgi:endonuclease/exonuclease/phosphatase family metal-dependent hydrolase